MVDPKIANELYRGVATSKPSSAEVTVCVKHVVAALGPAHPCSRNIKALAAAWTEAAGDSPPAVRRHITRALGDLPEGPGLDPECPISGSVVLRSADYVALPRRPLLEALTDAIRIPAEKPKAQPPPGDGKKK
ncbi:MAG: hypothetical protein ACE5KM_13800 [Planctomycetaceae bacterium]